MPRKYYKRTYNKDKYSIEITNFRTDQVSNWTSITGDGSDTADSFQSNYVIVPASDTQGMRKVKHLTISIGNTVANANAPIYYAIVYVPQGTDPLPIRTPLTGVSCNAYVANQFVMSCGSVDFDAGPTRIYTRISRNLNSGDRIMLVLASTLGGSAIYQGTVKYAITLQ